MKKKRISPFSLLIKMLQTQEQKDILFETLEPLKEEYRYDFCLACVAYIRFGIRRYFPNKMMQVLFLSYCEVLDN